MVSGYNIQYFFRELLLHLSFVERILAVAIPFVLTELLQTKIA